MITLAQIKKAIAGNPAVDQTIDFDGDEGFLLVLNDGWNWEAGDPGCHTRGWSWEEIGIDGKNRGPGIRGVKNDIKHIVPCDGSCGSDGCG